MFNFIMIILGSLVLLWFLILLYFFLYYYFVEEMRFKKGVSKYFGHGSKLVRLFIDLPRQLVIDRYNRDPDEFKEYGVHIIAGKQGCGKSITLTYLLNRYIKIYPNIKVATNYYFKEEDYHISHWKDILKINNGKFGVVVVLDEIQNWFNSLQSKDFPPEMLTEITQQRKQRKIIFGTSQVFSRVAKPIREQTYMLYIPITLFGCLTFVRKYDVEMNVDGLTDSKKFRGCFFFIHNKEIRESFDTYRKIENLSESGFKSDIERSANSDTSIKINIKSKKIDKKF